MPQVLTALVYFSLLHKSSIALNVYTRVLNLGAEMLFVVALYTNRVTGYLSNSLINFVKEQGALNTSKCLCNLFGASSMLLKTEL